MIRFVFLDWMLEIMESNQSVFFSNQFGAVTSEKVILYYPFGLRDLEMRSVKGLRLKHESNRFLGSLSLLIAAILTFLVATQSQIMGQSAVMILAVIILTAIWFGISVWMGKYEIHINGYGAAKAAEPVKVPRNRIDQAHNLIEAYNRSRRSIQ